ncbi:MAG: helix-turn-helix domain-containing protein [Actinomycetota bacterium]|nr:helix-turn-helix domain-containing protein [Actinomycetota bacterium]
MATIGAVMPRIDGEKLRQLREARFLSHRDLAKRASVSPTTVLNLEAGKVEAQRRTVRKLAEALGVDPSELVAGE